MELCQFFSVVLGSRVELYSLTRSRQNQRSQQYRTGRRHREMVGGMVIDATFGRTCRKPLSAYRRLQSLALVVACLSLLAACVGISSTELNSLGSTLTRADINFAELETYAERSRAAYG